MGYEKQGRIKNPSFLTTMKQYILASHANKETISDSYYLTFEEFSKKTGILNPSLPFLKQNRTNPRNRRSGIPL